MKKIFVFTVLFFMAAVCTGTAGSDEGPYVRGSLGLGMLSDSDMSNPGGTSAIEFDPGLALAAAAGYRFGMWRAEGELGYQKNGIDKVSDATGSAVASGDYIGFSAMANVYGDFYNHTCFTPFVTAGIGAAKIKVDSLSVAGALVGTASDTVFSWQVGAGVGYAMNEKLTLDLKYRYFRTRDPKFDNGWKTEFATHNVSLGLRYSF